jgi:DNA-binding beta-propeller fold protein YncE
VSVIDCAADTVVATVVIGRYPYHLAHNPQHDKIYVTLGSGNNLAVLDGDGDSLITMVNCIQSPYAVAYSERSGLAYVGVGARNLVLIEGATNEVRKTVSSGVRCEVFALNPAGGRVYAISSYSSDISVIVDSLTGVAETMNDERVTMNAGPTVVRGVLLGPQAVGRQPSAVLLDVAGRKVLDLHPGANDVRALAPGIYFLRAVSSELSAVSCQKVVLTE